METLQMSTLWKSQMSRFTWLVFLENRQSVFTNELIIPYNCEAVIIQKRNEGDYKLTEFYTVKNKPFTYDLAEWSHGLKITNLSQYYRRLNVNGTELRNFYTYYDVRQTPLRTFHNNFTLELLELEPGL